MVKKISERSEHDRHMQRIVINAARGVRLMDRARARSTSGGSSKGTTLVKGAAVFGAVLAPMLIGAALSGMLTSPAQAKIVSNPRAPSATSSTIPLVPGGISVADATTSSVAMVSRNQCAQFDLAEIAGQRAEFTTSAADATASRYR